MKKLKLLFFVFQFSFFTFHLSEAQIIHVPAEYPTIQEGIEAANPGDTVLVADGLYYENINFLGKKPLMVASHFLIDGDGNHINNTIIDGSQPDDPNIGSVVTFTSGEDTTSILCGFTVQGGTGTMILADFWAGGGVLIQYSGGKLLYNRIEDNTVNQSALIFGAGITAGGPVSPLPWVVLRNNLIQNNKAISQNDEADGGGISNFYNLIMVDNQIFNNEATGPYRGDGGGVFIHGDFGHIELEIRRNLIRFNKAVSNSEITDIVISGGIDIFNDCSGIVANNDISYNEIEVAEGRNCYGTGVMIEYIPSTDFIFENNAITNNTFNGTYCIGGGACIYNGFCRFQNNIVQDNTGTHGGGVTVGYNVDKQAVIMNNTITGNEGEFGGGLYAVSADAVVINTIIWGNTAPNGPSVYEDNCTLPVRYSDVEGDDYWPGEGNENVDPGFGEDGYHLSDSTPLWNEGITATVINGITYECPEYDIDGEPRPWGSSDPEIGADEITNVSVEESSVGSQWSAVECYPNPTSGIFNLQFTVYNLESIILKIYNTQGQEVATVLHDKLPAGEHTMQWDATELPAGIYYYRLTTDDRRLPTGTGKIMKY